MRYENHIQTNKVPINDSLHEMNTLEIVNRLKLSGNPRWMMSANSGTSMCLCVNECSFRIMQCALLREHISTINPISYSLTKPSHFLFPFTWMQVPALNSNRWNFLYSKFNRFESYLSFICQFGKIRISIRQMLLAIELRFSFSCFFLPPHPV